MTEFVPLCMAPEELAEWRVWNERTRGSYRATTPCQDCLAPFAKAMREQGLCNGALRGADKRPAKHDARRLRQWREATARKRAGIRIRRSAVELRALALELNTRLDAGGSLPAVAKRLGIDESYARNLRGDYRRGRWDEAA